jgi:hypothetical protein
VLCTGALGHGGVEVKAALEWGVAAGWLTKVLGVKHFNIEARLATAKRRG